MITLFLLVVISLLSKAPGCFAEEEEYYGNIGRLQQCPGTDDLFFKIHKMYMNYRGNRTYTMTFNISLEEDLDSPLDLKFDVRKCASEHGPCEDFMCHTIEDLCSELKVQDSIPYRLFAMAKFPVNCPFKKGTYSSEKSEINIPPELLALGKYGNYWKFNLTLERKPNISLFCIYVEGRVSKVTKVKRKKKGH